MEHHKIFAFSFETKQLVDSYLVCRRQPDRFGLYVHNATDGWYLCSITPRSEYMALVVEEKARFLRGN